MIRLVLNMEGELNDV